MKKILVLAANPRKNLDLGREIRDIQAVIERSQNREQFEVIPGLAVRVGDLQELLLKHQPQIVHFCGHGSDRKGLVFEGDNGGEQFVAIEALSNLFRLFSQQIECVILNACYSNDQAETIVKHINYAIGMNQTIRDDAARIFAEGFYRALGYGCPIEGAYELGCNAIQLEISESPKERSALSETKRKLVVEDVIATIKIPEHQKPILKKRATLTLDTNSNILSQEEKVEIQLAIDKSISSPYKLGGALNFNDPTYVRRDADNKLYEALKEGKTCCVLNSRQTGKSSLKVNLFHKLGQEDIACADIDLTGCIATETTSEQFYNDFITALIESLRSGGIKLDFNLKVWSQENEVQSPLHRLSLFIKNVILKQTSQNLVIFVDEIDKSLDLDFRSDFFGLIRSFYNKRSIESDYKRLAFVLLGVATPSDLIDDKWTTPFNIGQVITLEPFTLDDVSPLIGILGKALNKPEDESKVLMKEILNWTGGQPFLTQKLCDLIVTERQNNPSATVQEVVNAKIINNWQDQDTPPHLKTVRDRVITNEQKANYLLELYRQIRQVGSLPVQNRPGDEEQELQLSGLVVKREGNLQVYNPIYAEVFNESWINGELARLCP